MQRYTLESLRISMEPRTFDITVKMLRRYGFMRMEGANLVVNNHYTSLLLAYFLLIKKMTIIGTLRHTRVGLAPKMKKKKSR